MREPLREVDTGRAEQAKDKSTPPPPPPDQEDVVLLPIQLENDLMMYIYGPRRLLATDKERIKTYINLWLEDRVSPSTPNPTNDASTSIDN